MNQKIQNVLAAAEEVALAMKDYEYHKEADADAQARAKAANEDLIQARFRANVAQDKLDQACKALATGDA